MQSTFVSLVFFLCSFSMMAQETNPTFENVGNLTKGIYYHKNGTVAQVGWFLDGKLQGEWTTFDENGNKIALRHYNRGERTGKWFFWSPGGDVLREISYEDGRMRQIVEWNSGNPSR